MARVKNALIGTAVVGGSLCALFFGVAAVVLPLKKEHSLSETHRLLLKNGFDRAAAGCVTGYLDRTVSWTNGLSFYGVQVFSAADPRKVIQDTASYCGLTEKMAALAPAAFE